MTRMSAVTSVLACVMSVAIWSASATAQSTAAATQPTKETSDYIQKSATGDLFEIQSSELALKQAQSPEVKAFAQRMIDEHTKSSKALMAGIQTAGLQMQMPAKVDRAQEAKLNELRRMKGSEFDVAYMTEQVDAHNDALKLQKSYAAQGDNPPLKNTAANTATIIEHHMQDAQKIMKKVEAGGGSR